MPRRNGQTAKLAAIDARVEERHAENQKWQAETREQLTDIVNKLDALRLWRAKVTGVAIASSAIVSLLFKVLWR